MLVNSPVYQVEKLALNSASSAALVAQLGSSLEYRMSWSQISSNLLVHAVVSKEYVVFISQSLMSRDLLIRLLRRG